MDTDVMLVCCVGVGATAAAAGNDDAVVVACVGVTAAAVFCCVYMPSLRARIGAATGTIVLH